MWGGRRHESESSACGGTQSHEREQSRVTTSSCSQAARDRGEKAVQECGVSHKCTLGWCFLPPRTDNLVQSSIKLVLPAFSLLPRLVPKCCRREK